MSDNTKNYDEAAVKRLVDALHTNRLNVTFTKRDGSTRVMYCTLMPNDVQVVSEGGRTPSPDVVVVWDLEAEGFRSFRKDSIQGWDYAK